MKRDIGFVTKYMMEYDVVVPLYVIGGLTALVLVIIIILFHIKKNNLVFIRNTAWCLLAAYVFLALCATVIFREEAPEMRYSFRPFRGYSMIDYKMMAEKNLNILFFVPIGFLMKVAKKQGKMLQILCIGCFMSVSIEVMQLVTKRGVCNIDDVFHNSLGCFLGYGLCQLSYRIISKHCFQKQS